MIAKFDGQSVNIMIESGILDYYDDSDGVVTLELLTESDDNNLSEIIENNKKAFDKICCHICGFESEYKIEKYIKDRHFLVLLNTLTTEAKLHVVIESNFSDNIIDLENDMDEYEVAVELSDDEIDILSEFI
mgnify:CR=1 FL=1